MMSDTRDLGAGGHCLIECVGTRLARVVPPAVGRLCSVLGVIVLLAAVAAAQSTQSQPAEKPRVAVIDFSVKGDVGITDAGEVVAELVLTRFGQDRYQLVERTQLAALLKEMDLTIAVVRDSPEKVYGKLTGVEYLVLGSVNKLGNLVITARIVDVTTGGVAQTAEVSAEDARGLQNALGELVQLLQMTAKEKEEYLRSGPAPVALQSTSRPAQELSLDLGSNVTMTLMLIPAGKFMMGSPDNEGGRDSDEGPQHGVTITKPFYMGITEVTQEQYEAIMGNNPSKFTGPQNPVERVCWHEATEFCRRLSLKTGRSVRLPTEAEWEYACRAGSGGPFCFGDSDSPLAEYAWFTDNSAEAAHPVGQKRPNARGLYDMYGNVWEWCSDWYRDSYVDAATVDPQGPSSGATRAMRGGSWNGSPRSCRSAFRQWDAPEKAYNNVGFRVAVDSR